MTDIEPEEIRSATSTTRHMGSAFTHTIAVTHTLGQVAAIELVAALEQAAKDVLAKSGYVL
jgi:hypothetical protein